MRLQGSERDVSVLIQGNTTCYESTHTARGGGAHRGNTHQKRKKHSDAGVAGTHLDPANRADDPEHTRETRITSSSTSPLELGQLGAETLGDWRCRSERLEAHLGRWYDEVPTKLDLPPTAHTQ